MEQKNSKWFFYLILPLTAIAFFAAATYLYHLPDLRYQKAQEAFETGDYGTALALAKAEESERSDTLIDAIHLEQAKAAIQNGDAETAREYLALLPESSEVKELTRGLDYSDAVELFESGAWQEAIDAMQSLGGYGDSFAYIDRARVEIAEQHYREGDGALAVEELLSVGGEDNVARAYAIAIEVTGLEDSDEALRIIRGLDAETVQRMKLLRERQQQAQFCILAAGFFHTVGKRADGSVTAAGDDTYGQCDVSAWTDIAEIAAGAYHTVGLRSDGTVTATGDNTYGQCDVTDWRNVVHIAANNYDTIALTQSGELLYTGYSKYDMTASWPSDLRSIGAGSYAICALRQNGAFLASHESSSAPEFTNLISAAVQTGYAIGLKEDGTAVSHGISLPENWENLVALYAGTNRILGLTADGKLLEYAFRDREALLEHPLESVHAAANAGTHIAVLFEDGSVKCFGANTCGECNTETWNLLSE